jgi:hypothetical protein
MNRVRALACISTVIGASVALAQPSGVDWKAYGGAKLAPETDVSCFHDANSVLQQPDSHIRVWTKCLRDKELENFDQTTDIGKKIIDNAADKVAHAYIPPYALIDPNVDFNKGMEITAAEQVADLSYIQPVATIYYELNCSERMSRELSISVQTGDSRDTPRNWKYVPPEGNAANLLKILCPLR